MKTAHLLCSIEKMKNPSQKLLQNRHLLQHLKKKRKWKSKAQMQQRKKNPKKEISKSHMQKRKLDCRA